MKKKPLPGNPRRQNYLPRYSARAKFDLGRVGRVLGYYETLPYLPALPVFTIVIIVVFRKLPGHATTWYCWAVKHMSASYYYY